MAIAPEPWRRYFLSLLPQLHPETSETDMTDLNGYLEQKREALAARQARIDKGELGPQVIAAKVSTEGRSGIRRIRIRDFQVITDSPPDFAGYDLGPSSPELQLGILGSCLNHSFLIQAALLGVPVESLEVEVTGKLDPRARSKGHETTPVFPHDIAYKVHIVSAASEAEIERLRLAVDEACPILNLLRQPQKIEGRIQHATPAARHADADRKAAA